MNITRERRKAMVGGRTMTYQFSPEENATIIIQSMKNRIEQLRKMSPEEAQKEARASLVRAGIMNEDGSYTTPYAPDSNVQ